MSVETGLGRPSARERVKNWVVPVLGTAWIAFLGTQCVGLTATVGYLAAFGLSVVVAYVTDARRVSVLLVALVLGIAGLGGASVDCATGEPLVVELLLAVAAAIAVAYHADRQMIR